MKMKCVDELIEKICKSIEKQLDSDGSNAELREDVKALAALVAASENVTASEKKKKVMHAAGNSAL